MAGLINVQRTGRSAVSAFTHTRGTYELLYNSFKCLRALNLVPVRQVLYRQIYFTGIEAVSKVAAVGALIGIVIITQVANIVGLNALLVGKILVWIVVRELGPLFSAIIIIARSSTAIASELGSMQVNGEVDSLRIMGIDPIEYLIVPRILGVTLCVYVLAFYFQLGAVIGGLILSSLFLDILFLQQLGNIFSAVGLFEIIISFIKCLVFGLLITSSSCYHGLRVRSSITEIPQATTRSVMQSLVLIFVFDGIITVVSFI
ncbi:MAG: ABC transporter permease [Deltaproteobacteria bacterium]|nr:ABC transporter permease [Deltaproteobacteria bacterium]MBW2142245.1 ABC transporter permease [Deltaproteobacteria bacterium]MBW2324298.1 ABC transporter permease [Deltaproteobacteria bacterium]